MSTMATPTPTPTINLTEGDRKLLVNAWHCFKTMPVVGTLPHFGTKLS